VVPFRTYRGGVADDPLVLAGDFPPVSYEQWRVAVDAVLREKDFASLRSVTPDGITIEPLYSATEPGRSGSFKSPPVALRKSGSHSDGWDVRQRHALSTISATNAAIVTDLQRGVTSIELDTAGIEDVGGLAAVLADVLLDVAPVALVARDDGVDAGRWLLDLAEAQAVDPTALVADLGCDPISRLAATGTLAFACQESVDRVAAFALANASSFPLVRSVRADGAPYADAGASPATELAVTVATAIAYIRAMTSAGLDPTRAFDQVLLSITVGTDQFGDTAKLRALRMLWSRVGEVSGVPEASASIQATTAASTNSAVDPWTNMLRVTVGCAAAAFGGADIVTVHPFDSALGIPSELGLRIARNTQLALMEESGLHRVVDPAGGSWYVEELTNRLAEEAWTILQELETNGGVLAALLDGSLRERIDKTWQSTQDAVASGDRPIIGVSHFPDQGSERLERESHAPIPVSGGVQIVEPLPLRRLADAASASGDDSRKATS